MESTLACCLAVVFALACGSFVAYWFVSGAASNVKRARRSAQGKRDVFRQVGRPALGVAHFATSYKRIAVFADELSEMFAEKGVVLSIDEALAVLMVAAAGIGLVAGVIAASPVAALAACALVVVVAITRTHARAERRRDALRDAVPDALHAMGACFQAGFSLLQTFQQLAQELKGPLQKRFASASNRLETGQAISAAIDELRHGDTSSELAFVAVALDVQHEAGGSMRPVLEAARDTVEGELELRRSLKVQTAQARLSARVVTVMPFVLVALFSLISDGFLTPFFTSIAGMGLLSLAILMEVAGVLAVRRMLAVEVS